MTEEKNSQIIKIGHAWGVDINVHIQDLHLSIDTIYVKRFAVDCQLSLLWPEDKEMTINWPENIAQASEYANKWLKEAVLRGFDGATFEEAIMLITDACYLMGEAAQGSNALTVDWQNRQDGWLHSVEGLLQHVLGEQQHE